MNDPTAPSTLLLFLLGVLVMGTFILFLWAVNALKQWRHRPKSRTPRQTSATSAPSAPQATQSATIVSSTSIVPLRTWLDRVNNQPDRVPHIAAKGPSGSGKTTLVLAVLTDRPGKVLICTPKNEQDDPWGGAPAMRLTADLTFDQIEAALCAVYEEVKRRNVAGFDDWLTLVVDDYPWVAQECSSAAKVVTMVGNMGRSVRVRLILLAQTATVKSWGFEGNGEARGNFVFIDLEEDHRAVIYRWGKEPELIDTSRVAELAQRPIPPSRWWSVPQGVLERNGPTGSSPSSSAWTEQHVKVAAWIVGDPGISTREIARRLFPGTDGGGDYSTKAKGVRLLVEQVLGDSLLAVRTQNNTSEETPANGLTA